MLLTLLGRINLLKYLLSFHYTLVNDYKKARRMTELVMMSCLAIIVPYAIYACCFLNPKATVTNVLVETTKNNPLAEIAMLGWMIHYAIAYYRSL